jgi:hypothetical protein
MLAYAGVCWRMLAYADALLTGMEAKTFIHGMLQL